MKDVIVIGAGPAGLSAAIYCGRAGLNVLVLGFPERSRAWLAPKIENYFGFVGSGQNLLKIGFEQANMSGAQLLNEEVLEAKQGFELHTSKRSYRARALIFATGISMRSKLPSEKKFIGKGLSYCATCDGVFFKGKKVGVLGHSDYAAHEALALTSWTDDITIFTNGKELEISPELLGQLKGIKIDKRAVREVGGEQFLRWIKVDGEQLELDGLFIAEGLKPASMLAAELGVSTKDGYISVDQNCRTNIRAVYAAGDCTGEPFQIAKAVAQGMLAALSAISDLRR